MTKIRRLYYFDKKNMKEMISFLNNTDNYIDYIMFNPLILLHHLLPLKLKFLPETYIFKDGKKIKGLITVAPNKSASQKLEITKLFFDNNSYDIAYELIQYVTSKYKSMGATSFVVKIDDIQTPLINIFLSKCNFSQISYEKLWQIDCTQIDKRINKNLFRPFYNYDSHAVASLYNDELLPHFRPILNKNYKEFQDILFKGLSYYTEHKFVLEDKESKSISCYLSIQTTDNKNFIVDIIKSSWLQIEFDEIILFANYQISKRKKNYNLFIRTKKYTHQGEKQEKEFMQANYHCIQNQLVLTHSTAKILKTTQEEAKYIVLGQMYQNSALTSKTSTQR